VGKLAAIGWKSTDKALENAKKMYFLVPNVSFSCSKTVKNKIFLDRET